MSFEATCEQLQERSFSRTTDLQAAERVGFLDKKNQW